MKTRLLLYVEPTPYVGALLRHVVGAGGAQYEVCFVSANVTQDWGADVQVEGASVLCPRGAGIGCGGARVVRLLGRILRGQYRAAHLAGWGHPVLFLVIIALKLRGIPFTLESDSHLRPERGWRVWMKKLAYPMLFRWPALVLPAGQRQAAFFQFYGVPPDRIRVAHMTVDVAAIQSMPAVSRAEWRRRAGIPEAAVVCLFVGRLEPYKGVQFLVKAFEQIMTTAPSAHLVLVGDGSLSAELHASVAHWSARGLLLGRRSHADVIQWMRSSDLLVLPSASEQWGLVVNEAMACGLPVIASDAVGAADDLVENGVNGFIVPAADVDALANAMQTLVSDAALRRRMARASMKRIATWTIDREADIVRTALEGMLH